MNNDLIPTDGGAEHDGQTTPHQLHNAIGSREELRDNQPQLRRCGRISALAKGHSNLAESHEDAGQLRHRGP